MTFAELAPYTLIPTAIAFSVWKAKRDVRKERENMKGEFLQFRQDFLSIWSLSNAWAEEDPVISQQEEIPLEVKRYVGKLLLAYFRKEISLRTKDGYRVVGHSAIEKIIGVDKDFERLWKCLTQTPDIAFLDGIYVMRSEVMNRPGTSRHL